MLVSLVKALTGVFVFANAMRPKQSSKKFSILFKILSIKYTKALYRLCFEIATGLGCLVGLQPKVFF
jgi:hypothetical protein